MLLEDTHPCCALPAPPALPSTCPRGCGPGRRPLLDSPSGRPCPSASGWVQPMEDTRDKRMRDECRASPLLSLHQATPWQWLPPLGSPHVCTGSPSAFGNCSFSLHLQMGSDAHRYCSGLLSQPCRFNPPQMCKQCLSSP